MNNLLTPEQLKTFAGVYQYDPTLVDKDTKKQLLDAGYLTLQEISRREAVDKADLDYFYTGKPTL